MAADRSTPFRRHQKVVAAVDLPNVPAGTPGKVFLASGIRWIRYRVRFENGVELGSLDPKVLMDRGEWEERQREQRRAERLAAVG